MNKKLSLSWILIIVGIVIIGWVLPAITSLLAIGIVLIPIGVVLRVFGKRQERKEGKEEGWIDRLLKLRESEGFDIVDLFWIMLATLLSILLVIGLQSYYLFSPTFQGFYAPGGSSIHVGGNNSILASTIHLNILKNNVDFLNQYYNQFLQTSLTISGVILGVYGLIFVEIIKAIDNRKVKKDKESYYLFKPAMLIGSVFTITVLVASLFGIYSMNNLYQNYLVTTNTYLTYANYSNTNSNVSFTMTLSNSTKPTWLSLTNSASGFYSFISDVSQLIELGITGVVFSIFFYAGFVATTEPKKLSTGKTEKRKAD